MTLNLIAGARRYGARAVQGLVAASASEPKIERADAGNPQPDFLPGLDLGDLRTERPGGVKESVFV